MKSTIILIVLLFVMNCFVFGQDETSPKIIQLGKINQYATFLLMPTYLMGNVKGAKGSEVGVQVKINLQTGEVVEATAIYGHPFFKKHCESFALKAEFLTILKEFPTIYIKGILTYKVDDFDGKIIENKKAIPLIQFINPAVNTRKILSVPKPIYSKEAENFCAGGKVEVEVLVDEKGDVFGARAISGDELLHNSAVEVALKAKFTENKTLPFKNRGTISFDLLQILQNVLMQEL